MSTPLSLTFSAETLAPGLYIVPTPLGNLRDITLRALITLMSVDVIYCEDTRVSGKLLHHYGIAKTLRRYNDHSDERARGGIVAELGEKAVALISDAGTPLVSDPGFKLVRDVIAQGLPVHALPGPSAPLLALTLSGFATDRFTFAGFLPAKSKARQDACAELAGLAHTVIVFESVHRLAESLADLAAAMPNREAALCREMTKTFEEVDRDNLPALAARWAEKTAKGEVVLVIGPGAAQDDAVDSEAALKAALDSGLSVKDAVAQVTAQTGLPRRDVYQSALALTKA